MKPFKPWRSFADQLWKLLDRSLQTDGPADHPDQAMNADAVVVARGTFPC
nr:hypothetical protein [Burkholderia anthina]